MRAHVCCCVSASQSQSQRMLVRMYLCIWRRYTDTTIPSAFLQLHRLVSTSYTMISTVCWLRTHNIHMDTYKCSLSLSHRQVTHTTASAMEAHSETRWPALVCAQITPSFTSLSPVFVRQTHQTVWTKRNSCRCIIFCVLSASESNCAR